MRRAGASMHRTPPAVAVAWLGIHAARIERDGQRRLFPAPGPGRTRASMHGPEPSRPAGLDGSGLRLARQAEPGSGPAAARFAPHVRISDPHVGIGLVASMLRSRSADILSAAWPHPCGRRRCSAVFRASMPESPWG
jgi:hypothetical protein